MLQGWPVCSAKLGTAWASREAHVNMVESTIDRITTFASRIDRWPCREKEFRRTRWHLSLERIGW